MGVDISHIIRHDFREVKNREASKRFVEEKSSNSECR